MRGSPCLIKETLLNSTEKNPWIVTAPEPENARLLCNSLGITEPMAQLLINRGIRSTEDARLHLYGTLDEMGDPFLLQGMPEAIALIEEALGKKHAIRIFGDYDVDGVTSTAMLLSCLKSAGAQVDYYIPHRLDEGYGLSLHSIEKAHEEGIKLVITVDSGISDIDSIACAGQRGIKVLVTDHHEVPDILPEAHAIINPRQRTCPYPFKEFAGAGVAFKLIQAFHRSRGLPFPDEYLGLVTLGTIADVMPLSGENRLLVREGLKRLEHSPCHGIRALREISPRRQTMAPAKDLSFNLIPRLNAAGRMDRASLAVELLMCESAEEARERSRELDELNRERQRVEERIRKEILTLIEKRPGEYLDCKALVMAREGWNAGVLGISAARLAERLGKPVFLIALKDGKGRGSARTASGIDLFELMKEAGEVFLNYGGHSGAGGFDIREHNVPLLKQCLEKALERAPLIKESERRKADLELSLNDITEKLIEDIRLLEPFGEANPEPVLMLRSITLKDLQLVGGNAHLKLKLTDASSSLEGIAFHRGSLREHINHDDLLYDVIMVPEIDTFKGTPKPMARIIDIQYPDKTSSMLVCDPEKVMNGSGGAAVHPCPPLIINSRNVRNRINYLKGIGVHLTSGVIMARTQSELTLLAQSLGSEGVRLHLMRTNGARENIGCEQGFLLAFSRQAEDLEAIEDVIHFSPPPSLAHFASPLYRKARRIHFLFTYQQLDQEEKLQKLMEPAPEKIRKILYALRALAVEGPFREDPDRVVEIAADRHIRRITVEVAFKILRELTVIEDTGDGLCILRDIPVSRQSLSTSKLFMAFCEERSSFTHFKTLYRRSFDSLKEEILALIANKKA